MENPFFLFEHVPGLQTSLVKQTPVHCKNAILYQRNITIYITIYTKYWFASKYGPSEGLIDWTIYLYYKIYFFECGITIA